MKKWNGLAIVVLLFFGLGCNSELDRARALSQEKDYLMAAFLYHNVMSKEPDNEDAMKEYATLLCKTFKNDPDNYNNSKCLQYSKQLYDKFPASQEIKDWYKASLYQQSEDLYLSMQLKTAMESLQEYKKLDPKNGKVTFMIANCRFRLNTKEPYDYEELELAVKEYQEAISQTKEGDQIAIFSKKTPSMLQWEANMHTARIYELLLTEKLLRYNAQTAPLRKMQDQEAQKCRDLDKPKAKKACFDAVNEKNKEIPAYAPDATHFSALVAAYKKAKDLPVTNKFKRPLPYIQLGLALAKYKKDYEESVKWLEQADKMDETNLNAVINLKMIYDRLAEKAETDGKKDLKAQYEKKSESYDSRVASLKGQL